MNYKKSLIALFFAGLSVGAHAQTEIQWWHSMGGALGEWVNDLAKDFNASQKDYKVVPTFKGSYDESMTAAIAAYRAGNAPHILQVFEVGTATMMASKGAIVPVGKVMTDAGYKFDPNGDYVRKYIPELREIEGAEVHEPWNLINSNGYPAPIVDHSAERDEALARLEELKSLN